MSANTAETQRPADLPEIPPGPPLLFVISGPSGAGKDAVRDLLMSWGVPAHFVVTATNRPPRPDEVEGRDYHFLDDSEFDRLLAEDGFIEHAIVYGQKKGVPRAQVLEPLAAGRDVIARVDIQGAATLKALVPDCILIFLAPPSFEEGRKRLQGRDTESETELELRLQTAAEEMEAAGHFDYVIVNENGRLAETARRVVEIMAAEKAKRQEAGAGHASAG